MTSPPTLTAEMVASARAALATQGRREGSLDTTLRRSLDWIAAAVPLLRKHAWSYDGEYDIWDCDSCDAESKHKRESSRAKDHAPDCPLAALLSGFPEQAP